MYYNKKINEVITFYGMTKASRHYLKSFYTQKLDTTPILPFTRLQERKNASGERSLTFARSTMPTLPGLCLNAQGPP